MCDLISIFGVTSYSFWIITFTFDSVKSRFTWNRKCRYSENKYTQIRSLDAIQIEIILVTGCDWSWKLLKITNSKRYINTDTLFCKRKCWWFLNEHTTTVTFFVVCFVEWVLEWVVVASNTLIYLAVSTECKKTEQSNVEMKREKWKRSMMNTDTLIHNRFSVANENKYTTTTTKLLSACFFPLQSQSQTDERPNKRTKERTKHTLICM